jgi:hypothetical protein
MTLLTTFDKLIHLHPHPLPHEASPNIDTEAVIHGPAGPNKLIRFLAGHKTGF